MKPMSAILSTAAITLVASVAMAAPHYGAPATAGRASAQQIANKAGSLLYTARTSAVPPAQRDAVAKALNNVFQAAQRLAGGWSPQPGRDARIMRRNYRRLTRIFGWIRPAAWAQTQLAEIGAMVASFGPAPFVAPAPAPAMAKPYGNDVRMVVYNPYGNEAQPVVYQPYAAAPTAPRTVTYKPYTVTYTPYYGQPAAQNASFGWYKSSSSSW